MEAANDEKARLVAENQLARTMWGDQHVAAGSLGANPVGPTPPGPPSAGWGESLLQPPITRPIFSQWLKRLGL